MSHYDFSEDAPLDDKLREAAEEQLKYAGQVNAEAVEWAVKEHIKAPFDGLAVVAALIDFAEKQDPDKISVMWASAIFTLADREAHSNG